MKMNIVKSIKSTMLAVLLVTLAGQSIAADISGQVEVRKKGGRSTLDSFDHAVVYLTGKDKPLTTAAATEPVIVDQKNKLFFPRLMTIVKGQTVHFYNQDELDHNVFSTEEKNRFDLGRYSKGDFRTVTYNETGNYKVYCNIHQNMILDMVVLDNHHFAKTDEQGNYTLKNVPPGDYKLNFWHIYGGVETRDITVGDSALMVPAITLISTKVIREIQKHKNKDGKNYKKRKGRYRR